MFDVIVTKANAQKIVLVQNVSREEAKGWANYLRVAKGMACHIQPSPKHPTPNAIYAQA